MSVAVAGSISEHGLVSNPEALAIPVLIKAVDAGDDEPEDLGPPN